VELGWIGFILFILLIGLVARCTLHVARSQKILESTLLVSFLGISLAALFLHAWEDSAVAYTMWILLAVLLPSAKAGE
jgi:hypothetical protein